MSFIEQLFGLSPDGGNGSLEAALVLGAAAALAAVALWRLARARRGPWAAARQR
jgi:hypothetical protein